MDEMEINTYTEKSQFLTSRKHSEDEDERRPFARDRDRIIHSRAFRRMMHKTQIFNANTGDHYRNRLTHTLEVMQIARSLGRLLNLNEDLIEAVALGHDLGHTPYGHIGERTLHSILMNGIDGNIPAIKQGFKHNFQSVRVADSIETRCDEYVGINLTLATREGIIKHTKSTMANDETGLRDAVTYSHNDLDTSLMRMDMGFSYTLEGQVVAISDEIAQLTHDIEDGIRGNIISFSDFVKTPLFALFYPNNDSFFNASYNKRSELIKGLVGYLINDVKKASEKRIIKYHNKCGIPEYKNETLVYDERCVGFSEPTEKAAEELSKKRDSWIILSKDISQADSKAEYVIRQIFKAYYKHPKELPDYIIARYYGIVDIRNFNRSIMNEDVLKNDPCFIRLICDHIAGMSDQFAAREYNNLYVPDYC